MKYALAAVMILFALAPAKSVVLTLNAPSGDIAGLGWDSGELWAVDALNKNVYRLDPSSGNIIESFPTTVASGYEATGLAVQNGYIYVSSWNNGTNAYVYKYDYTGSYLGAVYMCGG